MTNLNLQVKEYLERNGFNTVVKRGDISVFEKASIGDSRETWITYSNSEPRVDNDRLWENLAIAQFDTSIKSYPKFEMLAGDRFSRWPFTKIPVRPIRARYQRTSAYTVF